MSKKSNQDAGKVVESKPKAETHQWIRCNNCGTDTHPDLVNCICENCKEQDWSEPFDA